MSPDTTDAICFCNSTLAWGGGENWHLNAARSMAARGHRVIMLCHPRGELHARALREPHLHTIALPLTRLSFLNPLLYLKLKALLQRERVRAVIMNLPSDLKAIGPAARAGGVSHVVYRRGSALPVRDSWLNRRLYGKIITKLIVNSEATRNQALINNPFLIPVERITVLPNGVDVAAFDTALEHARRNGERLTAPQTRSDGQGDNRVAAGGQPFVIGNAGRLNRQKGQHMLLLLLRRVRDAGLDCRLVIAGTGEREAELNALAQRLDLTDYVLFSGFLPDLSPFWLSIDLFVLTSLWEGFGNVLLEAGLASKPVFAFAVSNLPELITGANGRLFPLPVEERANCPDGPRDRAAPEKVGQKQGTVPESGEGKYVALDIMAGAVLEFARDPSLCGRMGQQGRRLAERFSQEASMDALEKLLS